MSDEIDRITDAIIEDTVITGIENARDGLVHVPHGTGKCLYCDKEQSGNRRWCDNYCRDDWEKECSRKSP